MTHATNTGTRIERLRYYHNLAVDGTVCYHWAGAAPAKKKCYQVTYCNSYFVAKVVCDQNHFSAAVIKVFVGSLFGHSFIKMSRYICLQYHDPARIFVRDGIMPPHDDVIKWKLFPCYWPFIRGIHRQATVLDAWASRVKCPARFVSHLHVLGRHRQMNVWA